LQFLREVSHESFLFTSSTFRFWGKSPTKCVLEDSRWVGSQLPAGTPEVCKEKSCCGV
jgi:hypothetical protein